MTKRDAIRTIIECTRLYHENLEGQNLLFIFGIPQKPEFFETVFLPRHFLHLTGVRTKLSSSDFYDRCLKNRLAESDFSMPRDGTAEMKLTVLPQLMRITRTAKMIGDYDSSKSQLFTEKLAGGVSACMGFVCDNRFYIPNTALREDIRNVTTKPQKRILAIYRKAIKEPQYGELCFLQKGLDISELHLPNDLLKKVESLTTGEKTSEPRVSVLDLLKTPVPRKSDQAPNLEKKSRCHDVDR